jgi:hypothetical protein
MATSRTTDGAAWAGWIIFATAMLLTIGVVNLIEGIVALVDPRRLILAPDRLIVVGVKGWGWTLLISGALLILTGIGLFTARTWARVAAVVIVALHAVSQVGWLAAYPVWSLLMIALDSVVLYALTAGWSAASEPGPHADGTERLGQHTSVG